MSHEHIVVIDDDPDVQEALRLMLEPQGFRITSCLTGPSGLAAARAEKPDLILLDIMLSTPSEGFHLAYELRKDDRVGHVPIIMISSIGQTMGLDFARETGSDYLPADRFLDKPLTASKVLDTVHEVLAHAK